MPERWKPVPGFEEEYEVSSEGRVYSHWSERCLSPYLNSDRSGEEYLRLDLRGKDGTRRQVYVHHLVLEAFDGDRPKGSHAHHRDGDQFNNSFGNLEWVAEEQHMEHHNGAPEEEDSAFAPEDEAPF